MTADMDGCSIRAYNRLERTNLDVLSMTTVASNLQPGFPESAFRVSRRLSRWLSWRVGYELAWISGAGFVIWLMACSRIRTSSIVRRFLLCRTRGSGSYP